jgi:hypothetical protein
MFSGGLDSTFVAAKAAAEHDELHLVTYLVPTMYGAGRLNLHLDELRAFCGREKIRHEVIDLRRPILQVRGGFFGIVADCARFRFAKPLCVGCKVMMHLATVRYCRRHGIARVLDGNVRVESSHALEQRPAFIERIGEVYRRHGISYESPIYDFNQAQAQASLADKFCLEDNRRREKEELVRMGFTLGRAIGDMHRSIQPQCWMNPPFGVLGAFWKARDENVRRYVDAKIARAVQLFGEDWLAGK